MNHLLQSFQAFAHEYVNDIVVFSHSLEEHLHHFNEVFCLFNSLKISLEPTKSYLRYLSVTFLEQRVDVFDLSINTEKIDVIFSLQFSTTLKVLKTYLDLTD